MFSNEKQVQLKSPQLLHERQVLGVNVIMLLNWQIVIQNNFFPNRDLHCGKKESA